MQSSRFSIAEAMGFSQGALAGWWVFWFDASTWPKRLAAARPQEAGRNRLVFLHWMRDDRQPNGASWKDFRR